jgi:hypothetical protein
MTARIFSDFTTKNVKSTWPSSWTASDLLPGHQFGSRTGRHHRGSFTIDSAKALVVVLKCALPWRSGAQEPHLGPTLGQLGAEEFRCRRRRPADHRFMLAYYRLPSLLATWLWSSTLTTFALFKLIL